MSWSNRLFLNVFLPLLLGVAIYLAFRPSHLRVFEWVTAVGADQIINDYRTILSHIRALLPAWIIYSLPNAFWVYSFVSFMLLVWEDANVSFSRLFLLVPSILAVLMEFGQKFNYLVGTFDIADLSFALVAGTIPLLEILRPRRFSG
jgi:hypothetical protein